MRAMQKYIFFNFLKELPNFRKKKLIFPIEIMDSADSAFERGRRGSQRQKESDR
jgi:hypothetical protein